MIEMNHKTIACNIVQRINYFYRLLLLLHTLKHKALFRDKNELRDDDDTARVIADRSADYSKGISAGFGIFFLT
jgi:hypothetical protein